MEYSWPMHESLTGEQDSLRSIGSDLIPDHQWDFYRDVIVSAHKTGKPFALGGAFAWGAYTGLFRNTKDIDLYVEKGHERLFIEAVTSIGAVDYYDTLPYDRGWIYRSTRDGFIADIIFNTANYIGPVDADYVTLGAELQLRDQRVRVIPAEELILNKLFILQRPRCDWFDVFNILYARIQSIDWSRLLEREGENAPLLSGALSVFGWLCPGRSQLIPEWVWQRLGIVRPVSIEPDFVESRVKLLDTRPWFMPALKPGEQIFVPGQK